MLNTTAPIEKFEIEERMTKFLPSQFEFIFAPERFSAIAGGYASGKTRAGVTKGLILSAIYPGNVGMILRYRGTDLEESTIPVFFEVCPPSWIKSFNKKSMTIVLRNGSVIMFRHLHDAKAQSKTRRVGANLGWFFIDQMEEIEREHWNAMISRLRLPRVPKKFGFGALNPAGHDWNWEDFFPAFVPWEKDKKGHALPRNGKFYQAIRPIEDVLGIAVNSEENKIGNGGFVEDKYFESLLQSYGEEYVNRYVYCTFDDFQGKIYKEFVAGFKNEDYSSVHNIEPFPIPKHWPLTVGIDVGGDSPWAVIPEYTDDNGNQIIVDGFVKRTAHSGEIVRWIKTHLPWQEDRTTFVIDWENRVAMMDLADQGIHCSVARKDVKPGIIRTQGYFHVNPARKLPEWYEETQNPLRYRRFLPSGSPRTFVFNSFQQFRAEHEKYHWDQNKMETPYKSSIERFDTCFVANTQILMADGSTKPISKICPDDFVKTRAGTHRVLHSGMVFQNAKVIRALFSDGSSLVGTPDHRLWTNRGWVAMNDLRYSDILSSWKTRSLLSMESSSSNTKANDTIVPSETIDSSSCIDISGESTKEESLLDGTSIIRTKISTTTKSTILFVSRLQSTLRNISRIWQSQPNLQLSGTDLLLGLDGIVKQEKRVGVSARQNVLPASNANNLLRPFNIRKNSVRRNVNRDGVESAVWMMSIVCVRFAKTLSRLIGMLKHAPAVEPVRLISLSSIEETLPVYNFHVEGQHEYYANGILVSNCDAHRYVIMTKPEPGAWDGEDRNWAELYKQDPMSAREMQQLDKRIRERQWRRMGGAALREADLDEIPEGPAKLRGDERFDWAGQGEL